MSEENSAIFLLGSNIDPKLDFIKSAINRIGLEIGDIVVESSIYETDPVGFKSDEQFLNKVIKVKTLLNPRDILDKILTIEIELGRKRKSGMYSSRTIDIDILYFNDEILNENDLIIPHPRLHERLFTLIPLNEIEPDMVHPILKKDHLTLLDECIDTNNVIKLNYE